MTAAIQIARTGSGWITVSRPATGAWPAWCVWRCCGQHHARYQGDRGHDAVEGPDGHNHPDGDLPSQRRHQVDASYRHNQSQSLSARQWKTIYIDPFLAWVESTALSQSVVGSPSMFALPGILTLHAIGIGFAVGVSAAIDLRILGVPRTSRSRNCAGSCRFCRPASG